MNLNVDQIILLLMLIIGTFSVWKDFKKKAEDAEGLEEIRNAFVPFLLMIFLAVIGLLSFI